jgi:uncharacterized protein YciI
MSSSEIPPGVELEDVYLIEAMYTAEAAERRPAVRGAHIRRAAELKAAGTTIEVGAYKDMTSSILLVRADSEEEALAIAREDIYVSAGVWGRITARPFGRVKT